MPPALALTANKAEILVIESASALNSLVSGVTPHFDAPDVLNGLLIPGFSDETVAFNHLPDPFSPQPFHFPPADTILSQPFHHQGLGFEISQPYTTMLNSGLEMDFNLGFLMPQSSSLEAQHNSLMDWQYRGVGGLGLEFFDSFEQVRDNNMPLLPPVPTSSPPVPCSPQTEPVDLTAVLNKKRGRNEVDESNILPAGDKRLKRKSIRATEMEIMTVEADIF